MENKYEPIFKLGDIVKVRGLDSLYVIRWMSNSDNIVTALCLPCYPSGKSDNRRSGIRATFSQLELVRSASIEPIYNLY